MHKLPFERKKVERSCWRRNLPHARHARLAEIFSRLPFFFFALYSKQSLFTDHAKHVQAFGLQTAVYLSLLVFLPLCRVLKINQTPGIGSTFPKSFRAIQRVSSCTVVLSGIDLKLPTSQHVQFRDFD